jgi:LuxR family maltose regulon positive regulatory protein
MGEPERGQEQAPGLVLVGTKLHVPGARPGLVERQALVDRLADGGNWKLTLVCAPAGWGKTLALGEWHASASETRPFAWVSLDEADDDPARFWSYVIAGLRTVAPGIGESALATLPTAGPGLVEVVLPTLINELATMTTPLVLVLDDYHVVHDDLVHDSIAYLLRYLPRTVHIAIATRADPPLPLGRLRAAGEVLELRAAELRFSDGEAEAFLNGSLGLDLDPEDVRLLQERTEGWPAGLQLAALSLRDRSDRSAFVRTFAGDDRQIGEYLHEVLQGLDAPVREFLIRTSILERLCAPLCDDVCGTDDAAARLADAHRSNLFLVALDGRSYWFRYHHLFRDLLRAELAREEPSVEPELHRRAFAWHHANGDVHEAIVHATAAGEISAAADLIARHSQPVASVSPRTVARWIDALPVDAVRADPRLSLARGWMSFWLGRPEEVEGWLRSIEDSSAHGRPLDGMGAIEMSATLLRSALEYQRGDVGRFLAVAERAMTLTAHETFPTGSLGSMVSGLGRYFSADPSGALEPLEEARRTAPTVGWAQLRVPTHAALGAAYADAGRVDRAEASTVEAERLLAEFSLAESPTASLVHVARAKVLELRDDLSGADTELARATELARRSGWLLDLAHALVLLAGLKRRRRDFDGARAAAREARAAVDSCRDPGALADMLARIERALQIAPARSAPHVDAELSERELAVLRLLATNLSQREIGSELYVSLNTVKSHTRSVFRKLGVASRGSAVTRGRELGLI